MRFPLGRGPGIIDRHGGIDIAILVSQHLPLVATNRERDVWAALGDGTRRAIVLMLAAGPMSVGDLAAQLPVTRPAVSQHLKVLKDAGLVDEEAVGTRRIYRVDAAGVAALREQLDGFWDRALAGFQNVVERSKRGTT
jgi:DNA-binding transcriptional ArsR family regulator